MRHKAVTIIVPTCREEDNVDELVRRLSAIEWRVQIQLLFIDDSPDGRTVEAIKSAGCYASPYFSIDFRHRDEDDRQDGLAGAVTMGFRDSHTRLVVVMDGDLQHPPETVPDLLAACDNGYHLAMASRYCPGGSSDGLDGRLRHFVSQAATTLAKLLFPVRMRNVSDPMTGFFAVDLSKVDLESLRASGFKILLELIAGQPSQLRSCDVPLTFGERHAGESKGDLMQGVKFLLQLVRLRCKVRIKGGRHRRQPALAN